MIDLLPDADQQQIIDSVAAFMAGELPVARLRPGATLDREAAAWPKIAELGCFGLGLPETAGGAGFSLAEEALAFRELGRGLASPAIFATTMAAHVAAAAGQVEVVAGLVSGTLRAAPAIVRDAGALLAIDADDADFLIVQTDRVSALYARDQFGDCTVGRAIDDAVSLQTVSGGGPARWRSDDPALIRRGQLLITAMLVGVGEQARDMAVAYAKERRQFDQPIGAFQAIKHRCADMAVRCEMALAQLLYAAIQERDGAPGAAFHGAAAAMMALDAALQNAAASIQVHGGIGFTAEYDAHRYLKRAHLLELLGAPMREQRARFLAEALPN
jgi:alkylation response protein AidB-like acyl-CoA dehydrogenase